MFRTVSTDKILCFRNTLIIIITNEAGNCQIHILFQPFDCEIRNIGTQDPTASDHRPPQHFSDWGKKANPQILMTTSRP